MTIDPHSAPAADVLIVGAGPTGLTLAVELARAGVPHVLIDAEPGPRHGSRGKGVQPRSLEILDDLGVGARIREHGRLAMPMHSTGPDGRTRRGGQVPQALAGRADIPYPASLITPEWRVEEALRERLTVLGGAVTFGSRLVELAQQGNQVVAVVARGDQVTEITARWVVGADGGHSVVRKQVGAAFVGTTREDVRVVLADLPVTGLNGDVWETWQHPDGLVSLCPLPSTDVYQYAASVRPGAEPRLDRAALQQTLEHRTGRQDITLGEPEWTSVWRANVRLVDRYRSGHVLLAGDAAHIHSPAGGQGMNTGIQDAHNLAWKLVAVLSGRADERLVDTYETERRPVAEHVLALSDARLAATIASNAVPITRDASTIQLDVGYRTSPLVADDRAHDALLRAGDRAPDGHVGTVHGSCRLFERLGGGRFTLLDFGDATDVEDLGPGVDVLHVHEEARGDADVADLDDALRAAYGAGATTLVLIRPDGYVSCISDAGSTAAVRRNLATVHGHPDE